MDLPIHVAIDDILKENVPEHRPLFTEMVQLGMGKKDHLEWTEIARWIKFEEAVDVGGKRWSKPHIPSLLFNSLIQLREILSEKDIILDLCETGWQNIIEKTLDQMEKSGQFQNEEMKEMVHEALQSPISHLNRKRRTSDVHKAETKKEKGNIPLMKKVPEGSEAFNILVGELDGLLKPISAFVRLAKPVLLPGLTEVPIETRFLFICMGPIGDGENVKEIGRSLATVMTEPGFCDTAYNAKNKSEFLKSIDQFMADLTVLPPGKWDPKTRIEPQGHQGSDNSDIDEEEELLMEQKIREEQGLVRSGRLCGGLFNDIKRKIPWYFSDFKDALSMQCFAAWIFLYFASLTSAVTFGGLLGKATHQNMAAIESLLSGCFCGIVYGLFSGQPLTILGSTGPMLVFETIVYDFCETYSIDYLEFRVWIGFYVAIVLFLCVIFDASAYVCLITRFTEDIFATLIGVIFMVEAIKNVAAVKKKYPINPNPHSFEGINCECRPNVTENFEFQSDINWTSVSFAECADEPYNGILVGSGCSYFPDVFLMSCLIFIGTFSIAILLQDFRTSSFFPNKVRQTLSDFSVLIAIVSMTCIDMAFGLSTPKLMVPEELSPTLKEERGWIIPPFGKNPMWTVFVAPIPAILASILIFMDQQITAMIVNRKDHKFKKGGGYHLDLFVLSCLILACSCLGIPWFVAATVDSLNHVKALKIESKSAAPGEKPKFFGVREQRVTNILIFTTIGLSVFLTPVIKRVPMPVLYGVFLYMGFSAMRGMKFFDRMLLFFMPSKHQPDHEFLRKVPIKRIHLYTFIQMACFAGLWVIKSIKITSILFPLMLIALIVIRKCLDFVFTQSELKVLDDLMPDIRNKKGKGKKEKILSVTEKALMLQNGVQSNDKV